MTENMLADVIALTKEAADSNLSVNAKAAVAGLVAIVAYLDAAMPSDKFMSLVRIAVDTVGFATAPTNGTTH